MPISAILPSLTASVKHKNSYSPTFSHLFLHIPGQTAQTHLFLLPSCSAA